MTLQEIIDFLADGIQTQTLDRTLITRCVILACDLGMMTASREAGTLMSPAQAPAQIAYTAYAAAMAPLAPWGTPAFAELPDQHQRAWEAVATAVLDAWQTQPRLQEAP